MNSYKVNFIFENSGSVMIDMPVLEKKFENNLGKIFENKRVNTILSKCLDQDALESMSVLEFQELFAVDEKSF